MFWWEQRRYAVVGAGAQRPGSAMLLLYRCDELRRWTYLGVLLDTADGLAGEIARADVWECPQLVETDGRWLLSPGEPRRRGAGPCGNIAAVAAPRRGSA